VKTLDASLALAREHPGPGPYIKVRDRQCNAFICAAGGKDCLAPDDRTGKLA
jgi:hypothetical protein